MRKVVSVIFDHDKGVAYGGSPVESGGKLLVY
jgi:hypothetical protein